MLRAVNNTVRRICYRGFANLPAPQTNPDILYTGVS